MNAVLSSAWQEDGPSRASLRLALVITRCSARARSCSWPHKRVSSMVLASWRTWRGLVAPSPVLCVVDRLSMRNGVMLMAGSAALALAYTGGSVGKLVVMYSINVFVTFSLSNLAMVRFWIKHRSDHAKWLRHLFAHLVGLALCMTILVITVLEKFAEGGWVTLVATGAIVALCFAIKHHYRLVVRALKKLDEDLPSPPEVEIARVTVPGSPNVAFAGGPTEGLFEHHSSRDPDPKKPVAMLLVGGYSGLGRQLSSRFFACSRTIRRRRFRQCRRRRLGIVQRSRSSRCAGTAHTREPSSV